MTGSDYRAVTEVPGAPARPIALRQAMQRYALTAARAGGRDLLEVACGSGMGLRALARTARSVTAGDVDRANVRDASRHAEGHARLVRLSAEWLPFRDASFDVVAVLEAVYYLREPLRLLREARRVLRNGGEIVVSTVNPAWRDFQPSPLSRGYFDSRMLHEMLDAEGFDPRIFAAFPAATGPTALTLSLLRRISLVARLPWPAAVRDGLRRLLHGPPSPFPADLAELGTDLAPMTSVGPGARDRLHQVLYAVGTKR